MNSNMYGCVVLIALSFVSVFGVCHIRNKARNQRERVNILENSKNGRHPEAIRIFDDPTKYLERKKNNQPVHLY